MRYHGIDWSGPLPELPVAEDSTAAVTMPRIACPVSDEDYFQLTMENNPLTQSDAFGIEIYIRVVDYISQKQGCNTGFLSC